MLYRVTGSFWVGCDGRVRTLRGRVSGVEVVADTRALAGDLALSAAVENLAGDSVVHAFDWEEDSPEVVEEIPTDQVLRRLGAPCLPGFAEV